MTLVNAEQQRVPGEVIAEPDREPVSPETRVRAVATTTSGATLQLRGGRWVLRVAHPRYWSAKHRVAVAPKSNGSITLTVHPKGSITGSLIVPDGQAVPAAIRAELRTGVTPVAFASAEPLDVVECPVIKALWTCAVPVGLPLDVSMSVDGHAPQYLWRVRAKPSTPVEVGRLGFFRGASIAGFVSPSGAEAAERVRIHVTKPDGTPVDVTPRAVAAGHEFHTTSDSSGFFHLGPLPPDSYHLMADTDDRLTGVVGVRLSSQQHLRLSTPLHLAEPATLRIQVAPVVDVARRPWRVRVTALLDENRGHRLVQGEAVNGNGEWKRVGLPAGRYKVDILTGEKALWTSREVDLVPDSPIENFQLEAVTVDGAITVGGKNFVGTVTISDQTSGIRGTYRAGEDGAFAGQLPVLNVGDASWSVELHSQASGWRRSLGHVPPSSWTGSRVRFDIDLTGGSIHGSVVDQSGQPQPKANVSVARAHLDSKAGPMGGEHFGLVTDERGEFRLDALSFGIYSVFASAEPGRRGFARLSDLTSVTVGEKNTNRLTVTLRDARMVRGRVVSPAGQPVPGISVAGASMEALDVPSRMQRTDDAGRFEFTVAPDTRTVSLLLFAEGRGRRSAIVRLEDSDQALDVVFDPAAVGTLVLDLPPVADSPQSLVWVSQDGAIDALPALIGWAADHGEVPKDGSVRIPFMSPGSYRVCRVRGVVEHQQFLARTLPGDRCNGGLLGPAGELTLKVPGPMNE